MRKEKKYTFPLKSLSFIREEVLNSCLIFKKKYSDRYVNSLYLDSPNYDNYHENLAGLSERSKVRIRWYTNNLNLQHPKNLNIEIKTRKNQYGGKILKPISLINEPYNYAKLNTFLREKLDPEILPFLDHLAEASLLVRYKREYFEDPYGDIRLTIDSDISYCKPEFENIFRFDKSESHKMNYGVLELKYPKLTQENTVGIDISNITQGRHSKYVVGMNLISR
jgi:SPX domain protein involved in polyphosphate accumulation